MSRIKWNAKEYQAHLAKSEKELFAERQLPFKLPSEDIIHEMAAKHFEGAEKLEYVFIILFHVLGLILTIVSLELEIDAC